MTLPPLASWVLCLVGLLPGSPGRSPQPAPADPPWLRVTTPSFTLYGNAPGARIREAGLELERLRAVLLRVTPRLSASSPLPTFVYVFASDASLEPYKPVVGGKPRSLSAYFVPAQDGNFIALAATSAGGVRSRTVYHEYLHFLMRNNFPAQPRWYDEGLAEFYSSFRADGTRARIGLPIEEHVAQMRRGPPSGLAALFGVVGESPEYTERSRQGLFYARSWALVHYLMRGDPARSAQLPVLLQRLQRGEPPEDAVRASFGTDLRGLESELSRYLRADRFSHAEIDLAGLTVPEAAEPTPMTRTQTLVALGNLLTRISDERHGRAEEHFQAVLSSDPREPDALAGLAMLRLRQGRDAEAAELLSAATDAGSRDFRVPFHHGELLLRSLSAAEGLAGEADRGLLARARAAFQRSLELNGEFLAARAALGRTYLWEEGDAARDGIPHLEAAARGLRSRPDVAMDLANLYGATGRDDEAHAVLREVLGGNAARVIEQRRRTAAFRKALRRVNELLAERRETEALALLESLVAATSAELRGALVEQVAPLRRGIARNLAARLYNEGIRKVGVPDYEGALAAFREAAAIAEDPALAAKARERVNEISRYLEWEKSRRKRRHG